MREGRIDLAELGQSAFFADLRREDRVWWKPLVGLLAGIVGAGLVTVVAMLIGGIAATLVMTSKGIPVTQLQTFLQTLTDPAYKPTYAVAMGILLFVAVANGMFFGGITFIAGLVQGRKFKSFITAAARFRWRMLLLGMLMFAAVVGPVLALDVVLSGKPPAFPVLTLAADLPRRLAYVGVAIVCLTIAAGVEELLCRGWLLKQTATWTRNVWVLLGVNGVLFAAMHFPDVDPNAFVGRALMGMGFVYMTLRTGGIEFSTGAHTANNFLLMMFVQTPPMGVPPPERFQPLALVTTVLAILGYVLITELVVRWKPLHGWGRSTVEMTPAEIEAF